MSRLPRNVRCPLCGEWFQRAGKWKGKKAAKKYKCPYCKGWIEISEIKEAFNIDKGLVMV